MAYERNAAPGALDVATERLSTCVQRYPADLLPRFYLGIAKSLTGYRGVAEAIEQFRYIEATGVEALRLTTQYNLAAAYIEKYTPEGFAYAEHLLSELVGELKRQGDLKPKPSWLRLVTGRSDEPHRVAELLFQAWAVLLFVQTRQKLWIHRTRKRGAEVDKAVENLKEQFGEFERDFTKAGGEQIIPGAEDIRADFWNGKGLWNESQAWFQWPAAETAAATGGLRVEDVAMGGGLGIVESLARKHADAAVECFQQALRYKHRWPPAMANLGRVYATLLGEMDRAIDLFTQLTRGSAQVEYSNYCLGVICVGREDYEAAVGFFEKAAPIPEAWPHRARILQTLGRPEEARAIWEQVLAEDPSDQEAAAAIAKLDIRGEHPQADGAAETEGPTGEPSGPPAAPRGSEEAVD